MHSEEQKPACLTLLQRLKLKSSQYPVQDHSTVQTGIHSAPSDMSDSFEVPPAWTMHQASRGDRGSQVHKLAMQTTKHEGRQLVAAQTLPAGNPVWTEQPFAHVLYRQHIKQVCVQHLYPQSLLEFRETAKLLIHV